MIATRWLLALTLTLLATRQAWGHPPPLGIGGFAGGALHPLFVPAHAMAIVALGLLIGVQRAWTWITPISFVIGLVGGLGVMTIGVVPALMNEIALGWALAAGIMVALERPVPEVLGCAGAVLIGFCIALDSPPEVISLSEANEMLVGTGVGAAVLLIAVVVGARYLTAGWRRIAARILGSWIAAGAILVLALKMGR